MNGELRQLLAMIDEAFSGASWHGPTLRGSLRGVSAEEAGWRPERSRHNIREIVVHAAYWKYTVRRKIRGEKRGSFPLKGSNWFLRPAKAGGPSWEEDIALLESEHGLLRKTIASLSAAGIHSRPSGGRSMAGRLVRGIAAHDLYHAGQIRLILRLMR